MEMTISNSKARLPSSGVSKELSAVRKRKLELEQAKQDKLMQKMQ